MTEVRVKTVSLALTPFEVRVLRKVVCFPDSDWQPTAAESSAMLRIRRKVLLADGESATWLDDIAS